MTTVNCYKRLCAVLLAFVLLALAAAPAARAAAPTATLSVTVNFWKEDSDEASFADEGIDRSREALLLRQSNGTYTLELPVRKLSRMGAKGYLAGLTIGSISYEGELSGSLEDGSAVLTIKNLPASVLTGNSVSRSLSVVCIIKMDLDLLGEMSPEARLCIAVN